MGLLNTTIVFNTWSLAYGIPLLYSYLWSEDGTRWSVPATCTEKCGITIPEMRMPSFNQETLVCSKGSERFPCASYPGLPMLFINAHAEMVAEYIIITSQIDQAFPVFHMCIEKHGMAWVREAMYTAQSSTLLRYCVLTNYSSYTFNSLPDQLWDREHFYYNWTFT